MPRILIRLGDMGSLTPLLLGLSSIGGEPEKLRRIVDGRVVVVTGASRGIGLEMARRLTCVGATVVGVARTAEALEQMESQTDLFHPLVGDLRDCEWAEGAGRRVVEEWGTPAVLISNAGHSIHRTLAESEDRFHDVARTAGVNYLGAVALSLPILQAMRRQVSGHLISVSTTNVDFPLPAWSAYTASKAAYETWLRCVAPELRGGNVAVTSVHLPRVATAMSAPTSGLYHLPELSVDQAADVLCRALVARPRFIQPWWARVGAVVAAGMPTSVERIWEFALTAGVRP